MVSWLNWESFHLSLEMKAVLFLIVALILAAPVLGGSLSLGFTSVPQRSVLDSLLQQLPSTFIPSSLKDGFLDSLLSGLKIPSSLASSRIQSLISAVTSQEIPSSFPTSFSPINVATGSASPLLASTAALALSFLL